MGTWDLRLVLALKCQVPVLVLGCLGHNEIQTTDVIFHRMGDKSLSSPAMTNWLAGRSPAGR